MCSAGNEGAVYGVGPGGTVNFVTRTPSGGTEPFDVATTPDGRHAVVVNRGSGDLVSYRVDARGAIHLTGTSSLGGAPDLVTINREGIGIAADSATKLSVGPSRPGHGALHLIGPIRCWIPGNAVAFGTDPASFANKSDDAAARGPPLRRGALHRRGIQTRSNLPSWRRGALTFIGSTPADSSDRFAVGYDTLSRSP